MIEHRTGAKHSADFHPCAECDEERGLANLNSLLADALWAEMHDQHPCDFEDEANAIAARLRAAGVVFPIDADHADCGDRCACYQRGVNDEWEATRD